MPTVLRIGRLRVVIYLNDHRPAHVHVIGDSEAVFRLRCPAGPAELVENFGFGRKEIARIEKALGLHSAQLCEAWEEIHGEA